MSHFQEQGRAAYKRKDYARAIELFDRAIGRAPSAQLHDNRAACHEKLKDLPAALKDARKTIQCAREDPTGYLRAGKVLLQMGKRETAAEIYSYGMRSIKHVGQGYELLRKAQKDLMNKLCPPKSVDPLTVLPPELALQVLGYLKFKQVMKACLVSKQWTQFIRGNAELWTHLDLTQAPPGRKVGNKFISRAINVARHKLTSITMNNLYDCDKAMHALLRQCPIQTVTLLNTGVQGNTMVSDLSGLATLRRLHIGEGTFFTQAMLLDILCRAEHLQELRCGGLTETYIRAAPDAHLKIVSKLKVLDVGWKEDFMSRAATDWAELFTKMLQVPQLHASLQSLRMVGLPVRPDGSEGLQDFHKFQSLEALNLCSGWAALNTIKLPLGLRALRIVDCGNTYSAGLPVRDSTDGWSIQSVHTLELSFPDVPFEICIRQLDNGVESEKPTLLRSLRLSKCDFAPSGQMIESDVRRLFKHPRLAELKDLALDSAHELNDMVMEIIADTLPELQSLNVSSTAITGVGLKCVVQTGHVKRITVTDCARLGHDAIAWAKTQGVQVESRSVEERTKGKRLWYE